MKIQGVVREKNGCDYFRVVLPLIYLNKDTDWRQNNVCEMLWIATQEHLIDCDILIYNKFIATPVEVLKQEQAKGMKIIVDMDDMWELPAWHPNHKLWTESGSEKLCIEHMRMADVVTCTSLKLQERIREYNKNTIVIPNAFPFGEGQYQPGAKNSSDKTRFIYAGGSTHLQDIEMLRGKFQKIGTDPFITGNAEFILAGYEQAKKRMYASQADLKAQNNNYKTEPYHGPYDTMKNVFSLTNNYRVIPTAPVTEYLNCYDHADVSLIPMVSNSWNSYKSVLKVLEAATRKIPCIVSAAEPYTSLREFENEGIMWVDKPDQWAKYIKWCIKNPQEVQNLGQKLYTWISEEYSLVTWNKTRKELFTSL